MTPKTYSDLPQIAGDLSAGAAPMIFELLQGARRLTGGRTFQNPLLLGKFGWPERLELSAIMASTSPLADLPADRTAATLIDGSIVHVALIDQRGIAHAIRDLGPASHGRDATGLLAFDAKGRPWFLETVPDRAEPALRRLSEEISGIVHAAVHAIHGPRVSLTGGQQFFGTFRLDLERLVGIGRDTVLAGPDASGVCLALKEFASMRIAERMEREEVIAGLVDKHLNPEILSQLRLGAGGDLVGNICPKFDDHDRRRAYGDALFDLSVRFLEGLRKDGLLEACPNNGPRRVGCMTAWNAFVAGGDARADTTIRWALDAAPAMRMIRNAITHVCLEFGDDIRAAEERGARIGPEEMVIPQGRLPELFARIHAALRHGFSTERGSPSLMLEEGLRAGSDNTTYVLAGSMLQPILAARPQRLSDDPVPLPLLEEPRPIIHLELPLPSGTLLMADWFRVAGFNEGLQALLGRDDHYEINHDAGLDERMRDYFQKAGLVIVQVGNSSPSCHSLEEGIWRMGRIDEDRVLDDLDPASAPKTLWSTTTDLWVNSFADRETIISILEASGLHADRSAAAAALDAHVEETLGVNRIAFGVDVLHVYAPTGAAINQHLFDRSFVAPEVSKPGWLEDLYILSDRPLTVDPEMVIESGWVAPEPMRHVLEEDGGSGPAW